MIDAPILTDGAWGTQLHALGLGPDESARSLEPRPSGSRGRGVPRLYAEAGSQIVLTNTFRANGIVLREKDPNVSVAAINRAGVEISRRAAAGRANVFASIGPSPASSS